MFSKSINCCMILFCLSFAVCVRADFDANRKADVFVNEGGALKWYEAIESDNGLVYSSDITTNSSAVAIGDFDGDKYCDVIIGKTGTNNLSVWYEATDGDYGGYVVVSSMLTGWVKPNGVALGDLDNDGYQEAFLALTNGNVQRYESSSNDTYVSLGTLTAGAIACGMGKVDNDNLADLFVAKSDGIHWYENNAWKRKFGDTNARAVVVGNVDNDSKGDLLVITSSGVVKWYEGGADNVNPTYLTSFDANAISVAIVDVDHDGLPEVCVSHASYGVTWYEAYPDDIADGTNLNSARNTIHKMDGNRFGSGATDIKGKCFDADNYSDVITIESGTAKWYESNRTNNRLGQIKALNTDNGSAVVMGYFDQDDKLDLIVGRTNTGNSSIWYEEDVNDNMLREVRTDLSGWVASNGLAMGDFDNDGNADLFVARTWGNVDRYENNGDNNFTGLGTYTSGGIACEMGRLDGDGYDDLFITKSTGISWYENSAFVLSFGDTNAKGIAIGRIDSDSADDLLVLTSGGTVKWYEANGNNTAPVYIATFGSNVSSMVCADIDHDGISEILLTITNGTTQYYESVADNKALSMSGSAIGTNSLAIASDFFDKDNKADVFTIDGNGVPQWYELVEDNALAYKTQITTGCSAIDLGDFDNDNRLDLIVGKSSGNAVWYEADNTEGGYAQVDNSLVSGAAANGIAIGKLDYDDYGDLFIVTSSGAVYWYEATSDNSYVTRSASVTTGGKACAFGDLDGDGLSDLLITKSTTLEWYEATGNNNEIVYVRSFNTIANAKAIAIGNLDNDLTSDVIVVASDGTVKWYYWPDGYANSPSVKLSFDSNAEGVALVDVDADGTYEVMVTHANGTVSWCESVKNSDGTFSILSVVGTSFGNGGADIAGLDFTRKNTTLPAIVYKRPCYNSYYDVFFPAIGKKELWGDDRLLSCNMEGVHPYDQWTVHMQSIDWGYSWGGGGWPIGFLIFLEIPSEANAIAIGTDTQRNYNSGNPARNYIGSIEFIDWQNNNSVLDCNIVFTRDVNEANFHRGLIRLNNGNLLANMFVKWQGDTARTSVVVESSDNGINWSYKSTVATRPTGGSSEGASESALVLLANGNIMAAVRMGEPMFDTFSQSEMITKISTDNGATWGTATQMGITTVDPGLIRLDSNKIALSYGRPGVHIKFAQSNGTNWSAPLSIYHGSGCGYTSMLNDRTGDIMFFYTQSEFADHQIYHHGNVNYMMEAKVAVDWPATPAINFSPWPTNRMEGTGVDWDLRWAPGARVTSHDVYFGTSYTAVNNATTMSAEYKGNVFGANYALNTLTNDTTYYWRIDARNSSGVNKGYVWWFKTQN